MYAHRVDRFVSVTLPRVEKEDSDEETLEAIATEAGHAILAVYDSSDFNVEMKSDDSPLTRADLASHAVIVEALARHFLRSRYCLRKARYRPSLSGKAGLDIF